MTQDPTPITEHRSNAIYSPPLNMSLDWVPEEERLIIDIWRQIDENSWLLGDVRLLSRRSTPWDPSDSSCLCTWYDRTHADTYFAIHNAPSPLPSTSRPIRPLHSSSPIRLVYDAGGGRLGQHGSAIWEVGGVFIKIKHTQWTLPPSRPREHIILDALHQRHMEAGLSFAYPKVLYHAEYSGRYYLITTRVPGTTVRHLWLSMDEAARQRCAENVARICRELASWRSQQMGLLNGAPEEKMVDWLDLRKGDAKHSTVEQAVETCKAFGMDVSVENENVFLPFTHAIANFSDVLVFLLRVSPR